METAIMVVTGIFMLVLGYLINVRGKTSLI